MTDRIDPVPSWTPDPPEVLRFPKLPTAEEVAERLGATSVGYIDSPANGMPGRFDAVVDGQLTRFTFTVEGTNASVKPTAATSGGQRPARQVKVVRLPPSPEVLRAELAAADRARFPDVQCRHRQAQVDFGAADLAEHVRATGAMPAWAHSMPRALTAAATRDTGLRRFTFTQAGRRCRVCRSAADGGSALCTDCADIAAEVE
jgi:hypothetical protein